MAQLLIIQSPPINLIISTKNHINRANLSNNSASPSKNTLQKTVKTVTIINALRESFAIFLFFFAYLSVSSSMHFILRVEIILQTITHAIGPA